MTLLVIAFLSGVLTVLAPCVLPLLPIVMGASAEDGNNKKIPFVIIASLSVSIIIFSLLLKASTVLIWVPPSFWKSFSGGMIIALGIITIFPNLWKSVTTKFGLSDNSNKLLNKSQEKKWMMKYIFMGFALGPVFSSCSPTYALILAIILPAWFLFGFTALLSYTLGLAVILFAIAVFGQKLIKNLKWASDPNGLFKKILWVVFVLVWLAIMFWYDKKIEAAILDTWFLNTTIFEQSIIDELELDDIEQDDDQASLKKNSHNLELSWETCKDGSCEKEIDGSLSFLDPQNILELSEDDVDRVVSSTGYKAPEFVWLTNWINSDPIDSIDDLKGKVVMLEFWTLGCINCIRTHEHTQAMQEKYEDQGFMVLGLHTPEFAYERLIENVQKSVNEYGMTYPVAQDNDFKTWRAFNNRYWPAFYLIDAQGKIRYTHFGEGKYDEKEQAIQELLAESTQSWILSLPEKKEATEIAPQFLFQGDGLATNTAKSSIDTNLILDGGPGKDGIPSINDPEFLPQSEAEKQMEYLGENSRWIVLDFWWEQRYYSYDVLVWHEIVNDTIGWEKVSVTFCPLCGSAIVYDRNVNGREINFGVSGKLYNSNLLMYDTHDETLWSQSLGEAVTGEQLGTKLEVVKSQLMSYPEFTKAFPNGAVLSDNTWFERRYWQIPYGDYDENDQLYFPVENSDDARFQKKELFYIVNNSANSIAFHWNDLRESWEAEIIVWSDIYRAVFSEGLADVTLNGEVLPGYFEMWFSWINHNEGSKNVWSKEL